MSRPRVAPVLAWALALVLPPVAAVAAAPAAADAVARVNGRPILRRDFDLAVQLQFAARRAGSVGIEELRSIRQQVLEQLIDGELLYQEAQKTGARAGDGDVEAEIRRVRESFNAPGRLAAVLEESGVTEEEFRGQIRRSLVVRGFVERQAAAAAPATEEDVRRYYDQNPAEVARPEAVRLSQIMVRVGPDASTGERAEARRKIEEILKEVRGGLDFAAAARRHSDGPEASRGGDTGWMARGAGPPPIERVAFDLPAGETSDVIETRLGFHLIRVADRRAAGPVPYEEAREAIRARLAAREREQALRALAERLREGARIERLPIEAAPPGRPVGPA